MTHQATRQAWGVVVWDLTYLCLIIALLRQLIPLLLLLKLIPLLPLLRRTSFLEICLQLLTRAMRLTSFWLTIEPTPTSFTSSWFFFPRVRDRGKKKLIP
ncbi:uncharacterized protein N7515_004782 [Penicillium bovifimosum]|uniref:Uncharacterized protein n=1 Tax=Penicillium bovifimosum TaxID=126998 RepID=A0A9W9H0S1_9EURO|nr:uncharacterized protein N7515_004782 [Penicillium bovifimosum]KAJ5135504.1 hypothetical protein N7515_004782 [Penicillium bovifimosum]